MSDEPRRMPWMPWRIFEGRQVPGRDTPRDNPEPDPGEDEDDDRHKPRRD